MKKNHFKSMLIVCVILTSCCLQKGNAQTWNLNGNAINSTTDFLGSINKRDVKFRTNNYTRMTIKSTGNVGIGTTTPPNKLTVIGNSSFIGKVSIGLHNAQKTLDVGDSNVVNNIRINSLFGPECGYELMVAYGFNSYRMAASGIYYRLIFSEDNFATDRTVIRLDPYDTFAPDSSDFLSSGNYDHLWSSVWATNGVIQTSDSRYKKNVAALQYGIKDIMKLRPVSYEWKNEKSKLGTGTNLGFIAQELEAVIPDAVIHSIHQKDRETGAEPKEKDSYGVKYVEIIPVLVKGIQEQQAQIDAQKTEIEKLKTQLTQLSNKAVNAEVARELSGPPASQNLLMQNQPNPFNQSTTIPYYLADEKTHGFIIIRDMKGNMVKEISISQSGKGMATIQANELVQGTYTYTLEIGGVSVDTKLMIVTR